MTGPAGSTPLHVAVQQPGSAELVWMLLEEGKARALEEDLAGVIAYDLALRAARLDLLPLFLRHAACE